MKTFKIRHKAAFRYARYVTDEYSRSFAVASRLLPLDRRWAVYALYGFCRYAHNLTEKPRMRTMDETLKEINHLKNEIIISYRTGDSEHPVVMSFIEAASHFQIPLEYPLEFLKGVVMDAEKRAYETSEDLKRYLYRVGGIVGLMMTYVLGFKSKAAFPYAEKMGEAMQLTNILRDLNEDRARGRFYIPRENINRFGVTESMLDSKKMTPEIEGLMRHLSGQAGILYEESVPGIVMLNRDSRFAIRCASRIYQGILSGIELNKYNPFRERPYLSGLEKIRIILNEAFSAGSSVF
jgi:phytoene synthase